MTGIHSGARVRHVATDRCGTVALTKINQTAIVRCDDGESLTCHVSELVNVLDEPERGERRTSTLVIKPAPQAYRDDVTDPLCGLTDVVDRTLFGWMDG